MSNQSSSLEELRTEIATVLRQVEITRHRDENSWRGGMSPVTAQDWGERAAWLESVLRKAADALEAAERQLGEAQRERDAELELSVKKTFLMSEKDRQIREAHATLASLHALVEQWRQIGSAEMDRVVEREPSDARTMAAGTATCRLLCADELSSWLTRQEDTPTDAPV